MKDTETPSGPKRSTRICHISDMSLYANHIHTKRLKIQTLQLRLVILKIPKDSGCSKNAECGVRSAECGFAGEPPPEVDAA